MSITDFQKLSDKKCCLHTNYIITLFIANCRLIYVKPNARQTGAFQKEDKDKLSDANTQARHWTNVEYCNFLGLHTAQGPQVVSLRDFLLLYRHIQVK